MSQTISWQDFERVEIRAGTIVSAEAFPEARKPAYKLVVDFGPDIGTRKSSAQITELYTTDELIDRQVIAVTNLNDSGAGSSHDAAELLACTAGPAARSLATQVGAKAANSKGSSPTSSAVCRRSSTRSGPVALPP